jgi:SAM-dependent methyltransferase
MAERAHPDDPSFRDRWTPFWLFGFIPCIRFARSPYRQALLWRYQWASEFCQRKDVLDIPCGMGWGTSLLEGARSLLGVDLSREAIEDARQRYGAQARFEVGDMAALPTTDASVDVVCCMEGIEHVPDDVATTFLAECHRVLRPGGQLLLSSPYLATGKHSGNPFHLHEYQPSEIRAVVQPWFTVEDEITRTVDRLQVLYLRCRLKPF